MLLDEELDDDDDADDSDRLTRDIKLIFCPPGTSSVLADNAFAFISKVSFTVVVVGRSVDMTTTNNIFCYIYLKTTTEKGRTKN